MVAIGASRRSEGSFRRPNLAFERSLGFPAGRWSATTDEFATRIGFSRQRATEPGARRREQPERKVSLANRVLGLWSQRGRRRFVWIVRQALGAKVRIQGRAPERSRSGLRNRVRRMAGADSGMRPPRHRHVAAVDWIEAALGHGASRGSRRSGSRSTALRRRRLRRTTASGASAANGRVLRGVSKSPARGERTSLRSP